MTPAQREVRFEFRDCSVTLAQTPRKTILRNVAGAVTAGEGVLAIMGPSGAGKTTLLNLISGMAGSRQERRSGTVTLNGVAFTGAIYKAQCAVVTQSDKTWTWLTCREHLRLAHEFHQASLASAEGLEAATEALLDKTGLTSCADLKSGTDDLLELGPVGLSGGQRRRLSLAIALAKKPALLIADEPTSGLDAAAAAAIMRLLNMLSRDDYVAVTCTIHQPSASVFEGMGKLLLLTKGHSAYYGPASELISYVASLGQPVPAGVSIAEHALNLVNSDFANDDAVEQMIEAWGKRAPPLATSESLPLPTATTRATGFRLFATLAEKMAKMDLRDPSMIVSKTTVPAGLLLTYGFGTFEARFREQDSVLPLYNSVIVYLTCPVFVSLLIILAINHRWPTYEREMKSAMYGPIAYWVVNTVLGVVICAVQSVATVIPVWLVNDYSASAAPKLFALMLPTCLFFDAFANFAGTLPLEIAVVLFGAVNLQTFMTSGFFFDIDKIIWPLRLFAYIVPGHFVFSAAIAIIFKESRDFSGAIRLSDASPEVLSASAAQAALSANKTFVCPNSPAICYADNGEDVLRELHTTYAAADVDTEWQVHACWVLLQAACERILFGLAMAVRYSYRLPEEGQKVTERTNLLANRL